MRVTSWFKPKQRKPSCAVFLGSFHWAELEAVYEWWRHQMETFSALLAISLGNSPLTGEFPAQRPVTRSFDVFFDLHLKKRLSEQWWGWWFETPSRPLWRNCNGLEQTKAAWPVSFSRSTFMLTFALARQCRIFCMLDTTCVLQISDTNYRY